MTNPTIPYTLIISANSAAGGTVIVEDIDQFDSANPSKNRIVENIDSNKKASVDLGNLLSGYSNGDKIRIKVSGSRSGETIHTVDTKKGSAKITISQTGTDYSGDSVSL